MSGVVLSQTHPSLGKLVLRSSASSASAHSSAVVERVGLSEHVGRTKHGWAAWIKLALSDVFLPHNFPHSVTPDYWDYQKWDTLQALCSSLSHTLATQATLETAGVGKADATIAAAMIQWILRDGTGMVGRIVFAKIQGRSLDCEAKQWRLFADVLDDCARCVQLLTPLFPAASRLPLMCTASVGFAIVGVAGGATRAALTQHQARASNMADVSAKDSSQETAVNLIAMLVSLAIVPLIDSTTPQGRLTAWALFLVCVFFHVLCNVNACRSVHLPTLNVRRLAPLALHLVGASQQGRALPEPPVVARLESLWLFPCRQDLAWVDVRGVLGATAGNLAFAEVCLAEATGMGTSRPGLVSHLSDCLGLFQGEQFAVVVVPHVSRWSQLLGRAGVRINVHLASSATALDEVKAALVAFLVSWLLRPAREQLPLRDGLRRARDAASAARALEAFHEKRLETLRALLRAVLGFVQDNWEAFVAQLRASGWETSRHHIRFGDWRSEWVSPP